MGELPKFLSEDWIEKARNKLDKSRMTPEQRMHFEMLLVKNASIIEMEKEERRREIEAAETKAKKENSIETGKKLLSKGMSLTGISEITGLTIQEIEELKTDYK